MKDEKPQFIEVHLRCLPLREGKSWRFGRPDVASDPQLRRPPQPESQAQMPYQPLPFRSLPRAGPHQEVLHQFGLFRFQVADGDYGRHGNGSGQAERNGEREPLHAQFAGESSEVVAETRRHDLQQEGHVRPPLTPGVDVLRVAHRLVAVAVQSLVLQRAVEALHHHERKFPHRDLRVDWLVWDRDGRGRGDGDGEDLGFHGAGVRHGELGRGLQQRTERHVHHAQVGHEQEGETERQTDFPQAGQNVRFDADAVQVIFVVLHGDLYAPDPDVLVDEILPPVRRQQQHGQRDLPRHVRQRVRRQPSGFASFRQSPGNFVRFDLVVVVVGVGVFNTFGFHGSQDYHKCRQLHQHGQEVEYYRGHFTLGVLGALRCEESEDGGQGTEGVHEQKAPHRVETGQYPEEEQTQTERVQGLHKEYLENTQQVMLRVLNF